MATWLERRREKKRLERERTGDSPEKIAQQARKGGPPPESVSSLEAMGNPASMWRHSVGKKPRDRGRR
jgi:hypothetical protein